MDMDSLDSLDARSKFFYDYADFLQRIKDTYDRNGAEVRGIFWNISTGLKTPSDVVGYEDEKVIEITLFNRVISDKKSIAKSWAKSKNITAFSATINWDNFQTNIEIAHDLKTVLNDKWGISKQKDFLRKRILEKCRGNNQVEFELTEQILGPFEEEGASSSQDVLILKQSDKNWETHIEFCKVIRALEKEGFLSLQGNIDINFDANFVHGPKRFLYGDDRYPYRYYPPEHCKIKVRVLAYEKEVEMQPVKIALEMLKNDPDYPERQGRIEAARVEKTAKRVIELAKSNTGSDNKKIKFSSDLYEDKGKPSLTLFGENIDVPKNSNQDYLCKVIFLKFPEKMSEELDKEELQKAESGQKEWSWEEVVTIWGDESLADNKDNWRKVYNAAHSINQRIAAKTQVEDFLLTPTINTVKINPKYLQ